MQKINYLTDYGPFGLVESSEFDAITLPHGFTQTAAWPYNVSIIP